VASSSATNQLSAATYDSAGNAIQNGGTNITFDAAGQIVAAAGSTYVYDGAGQRVSKPGKLYWRGVGSDTLAETNASNANPTRYIFFGGRRIGRLDPGATAPKYYVEDNVGSTALVTDSAGNPLSQSQFFPYGGEQVILANDTNTYKFSGKERDSESGLDDFGARYYASNLGRFMSPDWAAKPTAVPYANFGDPQSLNLYSYVENAPLNRVDADGHVSDSSPMLTNLWVGPPPDAEVLGWWHAQNLGSGWVPRYGDCDDLCVPLTAQFAASAAELKYLAQVQQAQENLAAQNTVLIAQNQTPTQPQSNQQSNAPANSRTDVVLYSNEYTPKPTMGTPWFWETTWKAGTCSGGSCSQSSANEKQTISLVESVNGGAFKPTGDPAKGTAHDQISPEPKTFNQHWFVDGKQVQLVVGKDSKGNLVKTWEVHVAIKNLGDRPVYSPGP
jgi:RHS repeat-associated protein